MFPGLTNLKTNTTPTTNMNGLGGDNKNINGIATQDLGGNSLTQQMRSIQNWLSTNGASTYQQGQDTTNTGIQGFGTAADSTGTAMGSTGTAMDTTGAALKSLNPAEDYWTKLLSGDQATMNQAIAPVATQAGTNYATAMTSANQNMPKGGYAGVLSASLPQAQAREVNQALYALQPTAATNLNTIANTKNAVAGTQSNIAGVQGNIAGVQGQLANWLSSLGIDISKLGLAGVQSANDSILNGRGQDVTEHGQAMNLAGATAGDLTGYGTMLGQAGKLPSDIRVKRNVTPYTDGLDVVLAINPIEYDYNGKGGTEDGKHYVSVSAQEIQQILPECVSASPCYLDTQPPERMLQIDPVPVVWALVNAVKTLTERIAVLEGER